MVELKDIKSSVATALAAAGFRVYTERVRRAETASGELIYIELSSEEESLGRAVRRRIKVELKYLPQNNGSRADWYSAAERIGAAVRPFVRVGERVLTVGNANAAFENDAGCYSFELAFFDTAEPSADDAPLMERISLGRNQS